jgi:hypothetical protein
MGTEPPPAADTSHAGKLSPEDIEERRDRLRKLREERERRAGKLGGDSTLPANPLVAPRPPAGFRPGLLKAVPPAKITPPAGDDAEVK